jgi:hypothetical protein
MNCVLGCRVYLDAYMNLFVKQVSAYSSNRMSHAVTDGVLHASRVDVGGR